MNQEEQWLLEEKYHGEKTGGFFTDCERLKAGEPLAYVIGHIPFLGTTIYLDSRPLIPRPETEFWVEKAIAEIKASGIEHPRILDLCAGSGCIGVAVAKATPEAFIDLIEIDDAHNSTIDHTIAENKINTNRCRAIISDLFAELDAEKKYDFILTNPPYINKALGRTQESVTRFEPHLALFAEAEGTSIIVKIIAQAHARLTENGVLYIEHEPEQTETILKEAHTHGFSATTHNDQYKTARYSTLRMAKLMQ